MTDQKKEILTEMLFNRKAILALNFSETGKLKIEVVPLKKSEPMSIKLGKILDLKILNL